MERFLYATAQKEDAGRRVKDFLRSRWGISVSLLVALKQWDDGITVNGQRVAVTFVLSEGDLVCLSVGDHGADSGFDAVPMALDILYEDADLILLNKPPFLPVHPSKGHVSDTLANGLTHYFHEKGEAFVSRCVLRLDANTSGAVLFAKNAYAHDRMRKQLMTGSVKKEYLALVHGRPSFHGKIDAPIYHPEEATLRRQVDPRGKSAQTEYFTEKTNGTLSLLRVIPHTGRTHQIRLHLSHIKTPIVSDFLYGDETDGILTRHGLHCASLTFFHPVTGKSVCVKAPLALDMARVAAELPAAERYRSLDGYLRETYREKLVKLSLNGGFSCPNREGGAGGCSFCSAGGSGDFAPSSLLPIREQLQIQKQALSRKWRGHRYIAYFQAYTNTYASVTRLRSLFMQALEDPQVAVLSIATRPDCLPSDVLDLLEELNRLKPLWVELGLQTCHDASAHRFGRGYDRIVYEEAARQLRKRGITVITHLIFGFPWESREEMLESVRYVSSFTDGVKLQMLQVLKGSSLGKIYEVSPFPLLTAEEYAELICDAISLLPPRVVIHRFTGDPPAHLLIEPRWTRDKKKVTALIARRLTEREIVQGKG